MCNSILSSKFKGKTDSPIEFKEDLLKFGKSADKPITTATLAFYFCCHPRKIDKVLTSFQKFGLCRKVTTVRTDSWIFVKEGKE